MLTGQCPNAKSILPDVQLPIETVQSKAAKHSPQTCISTPPRVERAATTFCRGCPWQDLVPPTNGQPLHIHVDIFVFEVSKIDDIALSITFELYFDLRWKETRLIVNDRDDSSEVTGEERDGVKANLKKNCLWCTGRQCGLGLSQ